MNNSSNSKQVSRCFATHIWLNSACLWASFGSVLGFSLKWALFSVMCGPDAEEEPGSEVLGVRGVAGPEVGCE